MTHKEERKTGDTVGCPQLQELPDHLEWDMSREKETLPHHQKLQQNFTLTSNYSLRVCETVPHTGSASLTVCTYKVIPYDQDAAGQFLLPTDITRHVSITRV